MTITDTEHDTSRDESRPDLIGADVAQPDQAEAEGEHVTDASTTGAEASDPVGELLAVDPRTLVIGANVRRDVALSKAFLRSIADRGVREPIIARRREDGALVVRKGKRRAVAAVEVGRPTVPVFVEPGAPGDTDIADTDRAEQIARIVDQLEENHHRAPTSEADEVRAHQELLDLGLTAGQIARRTHVPSARVKVTTAVARSELAAAVLERYDLTLDQVAVIAEFDDGTDAGVEAVKALTVTASKEPAKFEHVAQRLRDDRADARLVAGQVDELTTAGVRVINPEQAEGAQQISGLRAGAEVASGTELTAEAHAGCPGHAAQVEVRRGWDRQPQVRSCTGALIPTATGTSPAGTASPPLAPAVPVARRAG